MESWQKAAKSILALSEKGKKKYFDKFPERKEWFIKNHPEHFGGRTASQATSSIRAVTNAKIAAQKIADMRYKKALEASSDRVREMGRLRREGGQGLGGGLESNKDIVDYVRQHGSIKAGRLGGDLYEAWFIPALAGLGANVIRGGIIAVRAAKAANPQIGQFGRTWSALKGAGKEITSIPSGIAQAGRDLAYAVRHPIQAAKNAVSAQGRLKPSAGWSTKPQLNPPYGPGPGALSGKKLTGGNLFNPAGKYSLTSPAGVAGLVAADALTGFTGSRYVAGKVGDAYRYVTGSQPEPTIVSGPDYSGDESQPPVSGDSASPGGGPPTGVVPPASQLQKWTRDPMSDGYGKGQYELPGGVERHWASDPTEIEDDERLKEETLAEKTIQECMPMPMSPMPLKMRVLMMKSKDQDEGSDESEAEEEPGEYDYEGDMAKSQLRSIMHNSKMLHDMLEDNTNLPEWVQSKITLAEDYILTAANYMRSEMMNEEVEQVEDLPFEPNAQPVPQGSDMAQHGGMSRARHLARMAMAKAVSNLEKTPESMVGDHMALHAPQPVSEEAEKLDEFKVDKAIMAAAKLIPQKIVGGKMLPPKPPAPPVAAAGAIPPRGPGARKNPKDMTAAEYMQFYQERRANRKAVDQLVRDAGTKTAAGPTKTLLQNPYANLEEGRSLDPRDPKNAALTSVNAATNPGMDNYDMINRDALPVPPHRNIRGVQDRINYDKRKDAAEAKKKKIMGKVGKVIQKRKARPTDNPSANELVPRSMLPDVPGYPAGYEMKEEVVDQPVEQSVEQQVETPVAAEPVNSFVSAGSNFLTRTSSRLVYGDKNDQG